MTGKRPTGALFICAVAFILTAGGPATAHADSRCAPPAAQWAVVAHIYDGDTFRTADGRKVRLVGINAPERARDGRPADPFADKAREALAHFLPVGSSVGLAFDETERDRYGRTLAFAISSGSVDVQLALLQRGLAATLVVPPRRHAVNCYQRAENAARKGNLALWTLSRYRGIEADTLARGARGFHVLRGTVIRIGHSRTAVWLDLRGNVALRVARKDLGHFPHGWSAKTLNGRYVEVRGWIYERKGQRRITVRHPAALRPVPRPQ